MDYCPGGSIREIFMKDDDDSEQSDSHDGDFEESSSSSLDKIEGFRELFKMNLNSELHFKKIMRKLLYTVKFLHDIGIAHRDLKLDNIMLNSRSPYASQLDVKIIDFGLSKRFDPDDSSQFKFTSVVGTPHYLAPEVLQQNYNEKCDIWSLGVVCYLLFSQGQYPFDGCNEVKIYKRIQKQQVFLPE